LDFSLCYLGFKEKQFIYQKNFNILKKEVFQFSKNFSFSEMEETSGTGQQLRLQDFAGSRFLIKNLRGAQLWETARLAVKDQRCQNLTIDTEMFTCEVIST
jgi:uncharacterized protein YjbI with pentapeptide repeats